MMTALKSIVFLPFGYLVDLWRWKVFDGTIKPDDYNRQWWNLVYAHNGDLQNASITIQSLILYEEIRMYSMYILVYMYST